MLDDEPKRRDEVSESTEEQKGDEDVELEFILADSTSLLAVIGEPIKVERFDEQFDAVIPVGARRVAKRSEASVEPVAAVAQCAPSCLARLRATR